MDKDVAYKPFDMHCGVEGRSGVMIPKFLFTTSKNSLYVQGYCSQCRHELYMDMPLAGLAEVCPPPPAPPLSVAGRTVTKEDETFMKKFGSGFLPETNQKPGGDPQSQ